nr:retrovirus-related Pol polyprotein from transposon TNT 1-94 [Tanacetum cinerariifolium]
MSNSEDITDPIIAMNMELVLMAKAFKLNYSTPTNNKHRISSNPRNRKIAQPGMNMGQDRQMQMVRGNGGNQYRQYAGQNIRNQNEYNAVQNVWNQAEGNATGNNGNQIRCYNSKGLGHFLRNCTVRPMRRDAAYLQTQLLIAQKEEARIRLQAEEYDLMAAAADLDEIKELNANCILMANLQQASTSSTQTDKAPDENFSIVNQVDARLKIFKIQFLKEVTKFIQDFKSLAKEADESLAKHKALELEIEHLLRAVVSQDILSIVQSNSVMDTSNLQTELDHTKEQFENCIIKKENKYAKLWNDWINHFKPSREVKSVPNKVRESVKTKLITVSQPHVITKKDVNSNSNGCFKHMTRNLQLLINFVWKFLGTVHFGNDHVAVILGFGDFQWNDREDIEKLGAKGDIGFFIGYSADSCTYSVYNRRTKKIIETMNLLFGELSAMAFEQRSLKPGLNSMTFGHISSGLNLTYAPSTITTQQPSEVLRVLVFAGVSGRVIVGVVGVVESGWESGEVELQVGGKTGVNSVRLNWEGRDKTLVEAARTMLIFSRVSLFLWAEVIATACYTQNCSIIHRRFNKTPYELINGNKPNISFLHVSEALCYPKNDRKDIGKLGEKGDIGFFIDYSVDSCAYRVYNQRTKKIMEIMNVTFDELLAMAFEQSSSKPGL